MSVQSLVGRAGTGKTTRAFAILEAWLRQGVPSSQVLVLVANARLGAVYRQHLALLDLPNALNVTISTVAGLAQKEVAFYWPWLAPQVVPNWDGRPPVFLDIETAQYILSPFVMAVMEQGRFDALRLDEARLKTQILSNLAASAYNGISLEEVTQRLKGAWAGHSSRLAAYDAAYEVALAFRQHCQREALLDFSLTMSLFSDHLHRCPPYQKLWQERIRYLIADNLEEYFPVGLDFVQATLSHCHEALLIRDEGGGYRTFLGASPEEATKLSASFPQDILFASQVQSPVVRSLAQAFAAAIDGMDDLPALETPLHTALRLHLEAFYPSMLGAALRQVGRWIHEEGVTPNEIAILAPYMNDALRYSLFTGLEALGIPYRSYRPSRPLRDEATTRAILTCLRLVYAQADSPSPTMNAVAQMLSEFIAELDPLRADLLAQIVYKNGVLQPFESIKSEAMRTRISYRLGERYSQWLAFLQGAQQTAELTPPDHFLRRLFDLLTQAGWGFQANLDSGRIMSQLVASAFAFRSLISADFPDYRALSLRYVQLVGEGLLAGTANLHVDESVQAVLVAPAYTFLTDNRFVTYQVWLDAGSAAWFERLEQPLTHPYVLHRTYPLGQRWTSEAEFAIQTQNLSKLILGLLARCRRGVFLAFTDLSEQGYEQRGPLVALVNRLLGTYGRGDDDAALP
jgi:hypothetical protein